MKETFSTTTSLGFSLKHVFTNWFNFSGRAQRGEFWTWTLYYLYLYFMIRHFQDNENMLIILLILAFLVFIGNLALIVRRGHDCGYSAGISILAFLLPGVNLIWLVILGFTPSNPDPNKYGEIQ